MKDFTEKLDMLEKHIEACHREIEYHEKQIDGHRKDYNSLTDQWTELTAKKQITIAYEDLKVVFELLKIKDLDPQVEFFEYLRCVFIEHDVREEVRQHVENVLAELHDRQKKRGEKRDEEKYN